MFEKIKNFFKKLNSAPNGKVLRSTLLFTLVVVLVMGVAVFAWFAIDDSTAGLDFEVGEGLNAEITLYQYRDPSKDGSSGEELTLVNNIYDPGSPENKTYVHIPNPSSTSIIGNDALPNDKYSFAVVIKNVGRNGGFLSVHFSEVVALNFSSEITLDNIKNAFSYTVTRLCYQLSDGTEVPITTTTYKADNDHFGTSNSTHKLFSGVTISDSSQTSTSTVIVFFDFQFDPNINDSNGINGNAFMNQTIQIGKMSFLLT